MKRPTRPASAMGWWGFGLGVATVVWGTLFPSLAALLRLLLGGGSPESLRIPMGFSSAMLELIIAISAIAVGVIALRRGERSWMTLLAFVAALIVGGFWILFALGEVLWPH